MGRMQLFSEQQVVGMDYDYNNIDGYWLLGRL